MNPEERQRALELVDLIQLEHDHAKFIVLMEELNELLKRKEVRLIVENDGRPPADITTPRKRP